MWAPARLERRQAFLPGKGTQVALPPAPRSGDRQRLLSQEVEQMVVEAKRVGASLEEVKESIDAHWLSLDKLKVVSGDH